MRRVLILANTYFQLIVGIQLKCTVLCDEDITILLSDHSKNTDVICSRLKSIDGFSNTYHIKSKGMVAKRSRSAKLKDSMRISFGLNNRFFSYIEQIDDQYFDELICFNYNIDIISLYSMLYKMNRNIIVSLMEEGIFSYKYEVEKNYRRKIIKALRNIRGAKDASQALSNFYCFYPDVYQGNLKTVKVPMVKQDGLCSKILKTIFEVDDKKIEYKQKYIFFTSVLDFEGGKPIGEFGVVKAVSEFVGKDNMIVKTHPRDIRTIYSENGLNVDKNSSIPWEVIQLSGDFSDKVFLSATSGSVLTSSLLTEKPTKTFYMYKLCNIENNRFALDSVRFIEDILDNQQLKSVLKNVKIAENIEDILE